MVKIFLYKNGFKAYNHTDPIVCAAISALSINTVNSIDMLTSAKFTLESDDEGFMKFLLEDNNKDANLLLESFKLGVYSIKENYKEHIYIEECEYGYDS